MSCCQPTFHYVPLLADMLGTTDCLCSTLLQNVSKGVWRNGSASDSRSEGWEFESLCPQYCVLASLRRGHAHLLCIVPILTDAPRKEAVNICAAARECRAAFCGSPLPGGLLVAASCSFVSRVAPPLGPRCSLLATAAAS